jgi:putative nucleotidyltransferase with HDIG domain
VSLFGNKRRPTSAPPPPRTSTRSGFRPEDLELHIERLFRSEDYSPPMLPSSASQILLMTQRPDVGIDDIHGALEADPMLVATVLRLVRSPTYGRGDVRSLREALVRLGTARVRNLVMEVSMKGRVFKAPAYAGAMESLQKHSRAVAHLSRLVASRIHRDEDMAFLCGLLHDVGLMAILAAADHDESLGQPKLTELIPAARRLHAACSAQVARAWALPPGVQQVLAVHHQLYVQGRIHPVAATVSLGEALSFQLGHGVGAGLDPIAREDVEMAISELQLDAASLDELATEGRQLLTRLG